MIGVYTLANDPVAEQFIAFVKSFRKYNPDIPLTVIRFDTNMAALEKLSAKYNFKIWSHPLEQELYEIGTRFEPDSTTRAKLFKKFAAFWGEYDTFLFWDSDVVIADNLTPILEKFHAHEAQILFWDSEPMFAYKEGWLRDKMTREHNSAHMNTGTWGAKRNAVTIEDMRRYMLNFEEFKDELWEVGEQPFLNYCFDIKDLKKVRINQLIPDRAFSMWYDIPIESKGNRYYWAEPEHGQQMVGVHWAGCGFKNIYTHRSAPIFLYNRLLGEPLYYKYRYYLEFYHIRAIDLLKQPAHIKGLLSILFN